MVHGIPRDSSPIPTMRYCNNILLIHLCFTLGAGLLTPPTLRVGFLSGTVHSNNGSPMLPKEQLDVPDSSTSVVVTPKFSNLQLRLMSGAVLGALGAAWLTAGKNVFTAGIATILTLAQREYHTLAALQHIPGLPFLSSLVVNLCTWMAHTIPTLHSALVPLITISLSIWTLLSQSSLPTTNDLAKILFGLIYFVYLPSYWIKLRNLEGPLRFTLGTATMSHGAAIMLWTCLSVIASDVGAYLVGSTVGKHKLSQYSAAAGKASPNKSIEGVVGGMLSSALVSGYGAYKMNWPKYYKIGPLYGAIISIVSFFGDLIESVLKRNAGVKDSSNLIPGHGGVLDRIDSYVTTGPLAYYFAKTYLGQSNSNL